MRELATGQAEQSPTAPVVVLTTNMGVIKLLLDGEKAPLTTENFLRYVDDGYYDGTIFHRVVPGRLIQASGFGIDYKKKESRDPVKSEAHNGLRNERGTVAMSRNPAVHSATTQFFINLADNKDFDHRSKTRRGYGYAVFGRVIEGMDIADTIAEVPTTTIRPPGHPLAGSISFGNAPIRRIVIESAKRQ